MKRVLIMLIAVTALNAEQYTITTNNGRYATDSYTKDRSGNCISFYGRKLQFTPWLAKVKKYNFCGSFEIKTR